VGPVEGHQDDQGHDVQGETFFSLQKRKVRGDLTPLTTHLMGGCSEDRAMPFSEVCSDRISDNRHKLDCGMPIRH